MKKRQRYIIGMALVVAILVTIGMTAGRQRRQIRALSKEVLRFHILANSDRKEDQELKMQVKEQVLSWMQEELTGEENLEETKEWVQAHLPQICEKAEEVIEAAGASYTVSGSLVQDSFPDKTYGDVTFPAGEYDALRLVIGEGEGHNWWCVLYPALCFRDAVGGIVDEEGKGKLQKVLDEETYDMVLHPPKWRIRFWFFGKD